MIRKRAAVAALGFAGLLFAVGCESGGPRDLKSWGLSYHVQELAEPLPNRVHVLRVDLSGGQTEPVVVIGRDPDGSGPAETELTDPRKLAADEGVLAFVNTNPWDSFPDDAGKKNRHWYAGQPADIYGLAASGGRVRSPATPGPVEVWIDVQRRAFIDRKSPEGAVVEAMTGFQQIVNDGEVIAGPGGRRHPRTAIGVDRTGNILWLVVVDGRQKGFSEGMTTHELGRVMRDLGCWDAANMDGGGSSIMGLVGPDGKLGVVSSPSDRLLGIVRIRPLPMILTIRKSN